MALPFSPRREKGSAMSAAHARDATHPIAKRHGPTGRERTAKGPLANCQSPPQSGRMSFQEEGEVNPARRVAVSYIDKSREFYLAQGFGNPYRWAYNRDVPFAPLRKPLAGSRVALVTTTSLPGGDYPEDLADRPPKRAYAALADPPPAAMFTRDLSWDKEATHTDDVESFLPLRALQRFAAEGRIGGVSPRFYGVPTEYSQRKTNTVDAPDILAFCREDGVDIALLVPL
jgi:hypothetical protein